MHLEENTLFANRYNLERLIGRGGFSEVWVAKDSLTQLKVALKVYAPGSGMDERGVQLFSAEFALVFNLNHSNLLKPTYYDAFQRMPYLVLPFCEAGSASGLIGQISEEEAWRFLHDVACGLEYLHEQEPPVIHQDIKPDNVLIDNSGRFLLTDFGISIKARNTLRKSIMKSEGSVGTLAYMGPERFGKFPLPIKASDIFSLGATLYELLTDTVPFGEHGGLLLQHGAEIPEMMGEWSDELRQIINLCLQKETWERPSAKEIRIYCEQHQRGESPILPTNQAVATTTNKEEEKLIVQAAPSTTPESAPEPAPKEEEKADTEQTKESESIVEEAPRPALPEPLSPEEPTTDQTSEPKEPFDVEGQETDDSPSKKNFSVKAIVCLSLVLVGIAAAVYINHYLEQKEIEEIAFAKEMEIKTRYGEYTELIQNGDSLLYLGDNSKGDYEKFYLSALSRYESAIRLEEQYKDKFPELQNTAERKSNIQKKITEVYELFIEMGKEEEAAENYDLAEGYYRRAVNLNLESPELNEFHQRRKESNK